MSNSALKLLTASGATADPVYVDDVFSTFLHPGNGAAQTITNNIDLSGEGGLTWIKSRTHGGNHNLIDTVRGSSYVLEADGSSAQGTNTGQFTFNNNGFTINNVAAWDINQNNQNYVSWSFRKQPGFFDIVTYTGNGSNRSISHNLGSTPGMVIVKRTDASVEWHVWHRNGGDYASLSGAFGYLNDTDQFRSGGGTPVFQDGNMSATTFGVGTSNGTNANGGTFVAYLFAHDAQDFGTDSDEAIIKCGTYTGNGGDLSINLGFEPQWVMIKPANATGNWELFDNMRGISVRSSYTLRPNSSAQEADYAGGSLTLNANGFDVNVDFGVNGREYIYMAIRRPHKPASEFAATDLFAVDNNTTSASASVPNFVSGFPVDMGLANTVDESGYTSLSSRLTGKQMYTSARVVEEGTPEYDYSTGFKEGGSSTNADEVGWMWRRAPGFFDVVCYKGTGSAVWHNHNLGVVPEMIICKGRDIAEYWTVFTTAGGTSSRLHLDEGNEYMTNNAGQYFPTLPTTSQFRIGQNSEIGGSGYSYVAYLFASLDGISKLGTYTGTGSAQNIDCGFSAGARFVLIKRVNQAGYWMVWDSVRGIVAGNDPYLVLNTTAAHTTNTDYIDPLASGFTITSSAPTDNSDYTMNKADNTYFFYAIAQEYQL